MCIGISGSGKSTWAKQQKNFAIVNPDSIRKELTGDTSNHSQEVKVWKISKEKVCELLSKRVNVILDCTCVRTSFRTEFIKDLPECILKAKIFRINPKQARTRIKYDIYNEIDRSKVPDGILNEQYEHFQDGLKHLKRQGFEIIK